MGYLVDPILEVHSHDWNPPPQFHCIYFGCFRHHNQIRTQHKAVMGSDLSFTSALSINNNMEGSKMSSIRINEQRSDKYVPGQLLLPLRGNSPSGRKLLAYMKEYKQNLYTEPLFAGKLES